MSVECGFCGPLDIKTAADLNQHANSRAHLEKNAEAHGLFVVNEGEAVLNGEIVQLDDALRAAERDA